MDIHQLSQKKSQLDQHRPFPSALTQNLENWFRVELTYTSNAIEGNTLTRRETALVVEKGITVGGKPLKDHLEATNHAQAMDWVMNQSHRSISEITTHDILTIPNVLAMHILPSQDKMTMNLIKNVYDYKPFLRHITTTPRTFSNLYINTKTSILATLCPISTTILIPT